jgi:uncharacterized protein YjiK
VYDCAALDTTCQQTSLGDVTTLAHQPGTSHWTVNTINGQFLDVDAATGQQTVLPVYQIVSGMMWSRDGQQLYALHDGTLEAISGSTVTPLVKDIDTTPFAWSPDGNTIGYATGTGIQSVNVATGVTTTLITGNLGHITALGWSPDGQSLVYWGDQGLTITSLNGGAAIHDPVVPDGVPQWTIAP